MHTVGDLLRTLRSALQDRARDTAESESIRILEHVTGMSRQAILLGRAEPVSDRAWRRALELARTRAAGAPLAYVLRSAWFYHKQFEVTPHTLIPRPETETVIETILRYEPDQARRCLDMGTGSGAIADALAHCRSSWRVMAIDISAAALEIARINCAPSIALARMDRLEAISDAARLDIVVSNPPYIADDIYETLDSEVRLHEPPLALKGGPDGLAFYRYLSAAAHDRLAPGGRLYCEIGYDQGESAVSLFSAPRWAETRVFPDIAGRPRALRTVAAGSPPPEGAS
jgi:release factor glutamine methyltransferase